MTTEIYMRLKRAIAANPERPSVKRDVRMMDQDQVEQLAKDLGMNDGAKGQLVEKVRAVQNVGAAEVGEPKNKKSL